jgi:hypothetical protein
MGQISNVKGQNVNPDIKKNSLNKNENKKPWSSLTIFLVTCNEDIRCSQLTVFHF